ncbi:hypothetical protein ACFL21_00820 [Patescibacteria group bacterium]
MTIDKDDPNKGLENEKIVADSEKKEEQQATKAVDTAVGETKIKLSETSEDLNERARKELESLGLQAIPENVEVVAEMMTVPQHPKGYEDVIDALGNPDELKAKMEERGINSIIHSEGPTVWEHTKLAIESVDKLAGLSDEEKKDFKLVMLFHDIGKAEVLDSEDNNKLTEKRLEKGQLGRAMKNHENVRNDQMKAGLEKNGVEGAKLDELMLLIDNHMKSSMRQQGDKVLIPNIEALGPDDDERKRVLNLLVTVLKIDGDATEHLELKNGELVLSKNEKKTEINADKIWKKYIAAKKKVAAAEKKAIQKAEQAKFEQEVFGGKMADYLKGRGITPGPAFGKSIGMLKGVIARNRGKSPQEIKEIIDGTDL